MNLINSLKKVRQLKSVFILSSALVVSLSTFSCKDNDDRYVTPDITISSEVVDNTILFEKTGGEKSFGVSSNRPWKVEVNADWISVSPTSGNEGDTRVTVKTLDNSNGIARESMIKITTGTIVKNITVKQAGSTGFEIVTIIDENFNSGLGCWTSLAVTEGASWRTGEYKNDGYVEVSAHGSGKEKYETMLVSPAIEFKSSTKLSFKYKGHHAVAGTKLHVVLLDEAKKVIGEPFKTIDPSTPQTGYDKKYNDVEVDIPLTANAKYIALYYVGTKEFTTGFQIDNVKLVGGTGSVPVNCNGGDPAPSGDVTIVDDNFNSGLGCWTVASLTEKAAWGTGEYKNDGYVKVSAHGSGKAEYKTMLVSPVIDFKTETNLTFQYKAYYAVAGTKLHVVLLDEAKKVIGDPLKTIDPSTPEKGFDKQYNNVAVTIPLTSNAKHIALYYVGTDKFTTGFQVDNVKLVGGTGSVPVNCNGGDPTPTPTPTPTPSGDAVDNFNVNFEGLAKNTLPQGWTNETKEGTKTWRVSTFNNNSYVQMTSYNSKVADKVMLVSPKVKVEKDATLSFKKKVRYPVAGTILKVLLLDEGKNQVKEVKSYDLSAEHEFEPQSFEIKANNKVKYVAFLYEGDNTKTSTVQLDDIVLAPKGGGVTPTPTPTPDPTPSVGGADIFIHAYSEGKSFDKYIVLYNPTDKEVNLSGYKLACDQWTRKGVHTERSSNDLKGTIPAKGFKVFSHSKAASYKGETDKSINFQFTGDDCIALLKSDESVVDVFGPYYEKNQRWLDGDKEFAEDKTFIRKSSVTKPAKEYNADEWDIVDMNDFSRFTKR